MLYLLYRGNHQDLSYQGGQEPIVHLSADLRETVRWAERNGRRWALSDRYAGAGYADFFASLGDLDKINWTAVQARDWSNSLVKDGKQAEFLLYESFPWHLVEKIGVVNDKVRVCVEAALGEAAYRPAVSVERTWYY